MIDLREYAQAIKAAVAVENDKDPNWKWSAKNIGKSAVQIHWGYLDYIGAKHSFKIASSNDETLGDMLTAKDPQNPENFINFACVGGRFADVANAERGIESMVHAIASYAHSRY